MRIITNADDFGIDTDTAAATIECFQNAALTSATIMPKMPATDQAIAFAKSHPHFSFGVHLTFVCDTVESPVSPPEGLPALVGPDGKFLPSNRVRLMALRGAIPVDQIETEIAAQLARVRDWGVSISHVDSHGHLHKFKPFREALRRVLPRFNIHKVRGVQDLYLRRPFKSPTYWLGGIWRRRLKSLFVCPEHFFMCTSAADADWVDPLLAKARGESLEVGVHPGRAEPWRDAERQAVHRFADHARKAGHQLIGWKDL